jgi:hypothetical protein
MTKSSATLEQARAAKDVALKMFAKLAGEFSVGITPWEDGTYGLKVNLTTPPAPSTKFPTEVNGVPVRVEVVGRIRKR